MVEVPPSNLPADPWPLAAAERPLLPGLSIVLPCFDEQDNVERATDQALDAARRVTDRFEVLVVDDGSRDATAIRAARLAASQRAVRLVIHTGNRGYGAAARTGFQAARMPWVMLTDADLQFDLAELEMLAARANAADLIVGYRSRHPTSGHHRVFDRISNRLVHRCRIDVRDVGCGFKLIRRRVLERLALTSQGRALHTELLIKAVQHGATVTEVAVHHRPRSSGRRGTLAPRMTLRELRELLALRAQLGS